MTPVRPLVLVKEGTMFDRSPIHRLRTAWGNLLADERGDVPGWVLITLMTAGLPVITE